MFKNILAAEYVENGFQNRDRDGWQSGSSKTAIAVFQLRGVLFRSLDITLLSLGSQQHFLIRKATGSNSISQLLSAIMIEIIFNCILNISFLKKILKCLQSLLL